MTSHADCSLMLSSGGSIKCKMMNKCVLIGGSLKSLMPICTGGGSWFLRSQDIIGHHDRRGILSDAHMSRVPRGAEAIRRQTISQMSGDM